MSSLPATARLKEPTMSSAGSPAFPATWPPRLFSSTHASCCTLRYQARAHAWVSAHARQLGIGLPGVVTGDADVEFHGGRVRADLDDRHLAAVFFHVPVEGDRAGLIRLDEEA